MRNAFGFSVKTEHRANSTESFIVVYLFKAHWASLDLEDFLLVETANIKDTLYLFLLSPSLIIFDYDFLAIWAKAKYHQKCEPVVSVDGEILKQE